MRTIENDRQWLRDAQRFSVFVDFDLPSADDRLGVRVGAQASVVVYTGGNWIMNSLAWGPCTPGTLMSAAGEATHRNMTRVIGAK